MTQVVSPNSQKINIIQEAYLRIGYYLQPTTLMQSELLNNLFNHQIYFKVEAQQNTGSFKVRGVLNHLITLQEQHCLPNKLVTYSTGNHGIGLAWTAKQLNIKARIYLPKYTSLFKGELAKQYGGEVIYTNSRQEAEIYAHNDKDKGFYYLHPSDSDTTIAGAGTACYEALQQLSPAYPKAIFASCGGGGLLSGCYLAKQILSPNSLLFGVEPELANDAYRSMQQGSIFRFSSSPLTIADGLRTLSISERTFNYVRKLDGIYLVKEEDIKYWTLWLKDLLKINCEPSCAINMAAAARWLGQQNKPCKILIILSGGNIDEELYLQLQKVDSLSLPPSEYLKRLNNYN